MGVRGGRVYNKQGTNDVFRDENATSKVRMVCYTVGNATNIILWGCDTKVGNFCDVL